MNTVILQHVTNYWIFYLVVFLVAVISALVEAFRLSKIKQRYNLVATGVITPEMFVHGLARLIKCKPPAHDSKSKKSGEKPPEVNKNKQKER